MKVQKGLATWAGLVAATGQYLAAVAVFLEADNQSDALGPLVTATATLLAVIVGRMQQAKALAASPAKSYVDRDLTRWGGVTSSTGNVSLAQAVADVARGQIGGKLGLGLQSKTRALGEPIDLSLEIPGDPDALPDYETETDPPPDEGDTSANGDTGERES